MQSWKKKINKTLHKNSFFFKQYLNIFPFSHYKFVFWAWKISFVGLCFVMIPGGWLSSHCEPIYPSTRPKIKKKKKSFVRTNSEKMLSFWLWHLHALHITSQLDVMRNIHKKMMQLLCSSVLYLLLLLLLARSLMSVVKRGRNPAVRHGRKSLYRYDDIWLFLLLFDCSFKS